MINLERNQHGCHYEAIFYDLLVLFYDDKVFLKKNMFCSEPPFHLTRRGWGEFPVRIQIHFKDPRNKRIDIIHQLKVCLEYIVFIQKNPASLKIYQRSLNLIM